MNDQWIAEVTNDPARDFELCCCQHSKTDPFRQSEIDPPRPCLKKGSGVSGAGFHRSFTKHISTSSSPSRSSRSRALGSRARSGERSERTLDAIFRGRQAGRAKRRWIIYSALDWA